MFAAMLCCACGRGCVGLRVSHRSYSVVLLCDAAGVGLLCGVVWCEPTDCVAACGLVTAFAGVPCPYTAAVQYQVQHCGARRVSRCNCCSMCRVRVCAVGGVYKSSEQTAVDPLCHCVHVHPCGLCGVILQLQLQHGP